MQVALLVQELYQLSVYLVLVLCISTLDLILACPHVQMGPIKIQLLTFAQLVKALAQLAQLVQALTACLAQFLCIIKQQRNSVFQLVITGNMQLPLLLHFAQPANLVAQPALEEHPINVFHVVGPCI